MKMELTGSIIDENGNECIINENTLLIFIDETGNELLNDNMYPFFGFGGVAIPASLYQCNLCLPWNYIKNEFFNGQSKVLHATDLRNPTIEQMNILNRFFSTFSFGRFATVISNDTEITFDVNLFDLLASSLHARLKKIVSNTSHTDIIFIFESNQRTDEIIASYFSKYKFIKKINNQEIETKVNRFRMNKSQIEPGLEVADFIIHSAGTTIRSLEQGKITKPTERKDFECIFKTQDPRISDFIYITKVIKEQKKRSEITV